MVELLPIFKKAYWSLAGLGGLYFICLGLLTVPWIQSNAVYMNKLTLTWNLDLAKPEQFGFAKNQVTPFYLDTPDGEKIFAWHVLPLGLYMKHRDDLAEQDTGVSANPLATDNLQLLINDPEARLIVHFHGNAGTLGAGYRPAYMRSLSAGDPSKIHILAIDYRGFGLSTGTPSEPGLITDGITAVRFAIEKLGIPPARIALLGQSLGTAVTFGVAEALVTDPKQPTELGAVFSIAGFGNMRTLINTYRIAGLIPILRPLYMYPRIQAWFSEFLYEPWRSEQRVASLVRASKNLNLILMHAENDIEIPYEHVDTLFLSAVNATSVSGVSVKELENTKEKKVYGDESVRSRWPASKSDGNSIVQWIVKWGGHNKVVMSAGTSVIVAKALGL